MKSKRQKTPEVRELERTTEIISECYKMVGETVDNLPYSKEMDCLVLLVNIRLEQEKIDRVIETRELWFILCAIRKSGKLPRLVR